MNRRALIVVACAAFLLAGGAVFAKDPSANPTELGRLCERIRPAFVFIGGGSGVVISPEGLMLTNAHVIGKGKQFDVRLGNGQHFTAKLSGKDVSGDLAVLQLENKSGENIPHLELGDADQLRLGDRVLAIGNPIGKGFMDLEPTFTTGVISGVDLLHGTYPDAVVTDAPVNPGNSGGPLVNMRGQVVGIVGQLRTRWGLRSNTGLGFAISARRIAVWLPRLKDSGGKEVRHGSIPGMEFEQSESSTWISRPQVASVVEGSHAAKCGFQKGDVITGVEGVPVATFARLRGLVNVYPEGHELSVEIERDGKTETIAAKLVPTRPGKLGIELAKPGDKDSYVRIAKVEDPSPAAKAGVKEGDEIVAIGGARLTLPVATQYAVLGAWLKQGIFVDDVVELTVRRKNDKGEYVEHELRVVPK
jgi:S1-C subfamily serine protease